MFDYTQNFKHLDFRMSPELYRVGPGEQGVLLVEPYKSEILPHWRFKTSKEAKASALSISRLFQSYLAEGDFAGMDMARKFLQMGFTRSRRYANHRSGQKYKGQVPKKFRGKSGAHGRARLPLQPDLEKQKSAEIFRRAWAKVERCKEYRSLKADWKIWYG